VVIRLELSNIIPLCLFLCAVFRFDYYKGGAQTVNALRMILIYDMISLCISINVMSMVLALSYE
jgi:hypothetical protein